jgi:hypothetical protein
MATKIIHKKSSVSGSQPSATDLQPGELALNLADKIIYSKTTNGSIITMGATELEALIDVDTTTIEPIESYVLTWNNTDRTWEPRAVPTAANISLGTWTLGSSSTSGWSVSEGSGILTFRYGILTVMSVYGDGSINLHGDLYANSDAIGGTTSSEIGLGEWGYHDVGNNFYFQYESTNLMRITSTGDLYLAGALDVNATIAGNNSSSYYFINGGAYKLEITSTGNVSISGDINA